MTTPEYPEPRRSRTGLVLALLIVAAVLIVAGATTAIVVANRGSSAPQPVQNSTAIMLATVTLTNSSGVLNLDDVLCQGMGGYSDLAPGAPATVTDEHGTVIGAGVLSEGNLVSSGPTRQCVFKVEIDDLPRGRAFYGLTISHRGTVQFTEGQLSRVDVTIG